MKLKQDDRGRFTALLLKNNNNINPSNNSSIVQLKQYVWLSKVGIHFLPLNFVMGTGALQTSTLCSALLK